jgi:hypothetical protein
MRGQLANVDDSPALSCARIFQPFTENTRSLAAQAYIDSVGVVDADVEYSVSLCTGLHHSLVAVLVPGAIERWVWCAKRVLFL